MKTNTNFFKSQLAFSLKKILYAMQVLIITFAIPVLFYAGLSHHDSTAQKSTEQNNKMINTKTEVIAYTLK